MAGSAQVKITPEGALPLAGFDDPRSGLRVLDDLYTKALVLRHEKKTMALVSLDLLWISRGFCDDLREWAYRELGLEKNSLMVTATHTHSGPQTRELSFDGCPIDIHYLNLVAQKTRLVIQQAFAALTPSKIEYGSGHTNIAVNRRKIIVDPDKLKKFQWRHKVANRPNPRGLKDDSLSIIWITPLDDGPTTALINTACHPCIWRGQMYSADFPGYLADALTEYIDRPVRSIFLQGFSGNLKSRLSRHVPLKFWPPSRLYETLFDRVQFEKNASYEQLKNVAQELTADILNIDLLPFNKIHLASREIEVNVSLQDPPAIDYLCHLSKSPNLLQSSYAEYLLKNYDELDKVSVRLQCLEISPQLCLVGVEGEVFCEYALWLRKRFNNNCKLIIPVSCCGGMVGYIPDEASQHQGGYEVKRSLMTFGLPSGFSTRLEQTIKQALNDVIEGDC